MALAKGSWRKGELRLSKSDGIVIWVSEALYQDTRIQEGAFVSQYDNWPRLLSFRKPHELINPDPPRLNLFYSFQQMNDILLCPNLWRVGTDGSVRVPEGTMGTGVYLCPPNLRAGEVCPASCRCGKGVGAGKQASRDTILKRCEVAEERVNQGFWTDTHLEWKMISRHYERKWQVFLLPYKNRYFYICCLGDRLTRCTH